MSKLRHFIYIFLLIIIDNAFILSQSSIIGTTFIYQSEKLPLNISVTTLNRVKNSNFIKTFTIKSGEYRLDSLLNGMVDLEFYLEGCYKTVIRNIPVMNDTIVLNKVPLFEATYEKYWEEWSVEKHFFGLIKRNKMQGGVIKVNNSKFNKDNRICIECMESPENSIIFQLNPETETVDIQYYELTKCENYRY